MTVAAAVLLVAAWVGLCVIVRERDRRARALARLEARLEAYDRAVASARSMEKAFASMVAPTARASAAISEFGKLLAESGLTLDYDETPLLRLEGGE